MSFVLDSRLEADTFEVRDLTLCAVRLMNDARFPWLILVPRRSGVTEIIDLSVGDRVLLMDEIAASSDVLRRLFYPHKLNVAALGNMVRQLHVHVIARQQDDTAWPNPVWGADRAELYSDDALKDMLDKLNHAFGRA